MRDTCLFTSSGMAYLYPLYKPHCRVDTRKEYSYETDLPSDVCICSIKSRDQMKTVAQRDQLQNVRHFTLIVCQVYLFFSAVICNIYAHVITQENLSSRFVTM